MRQTPENELRYGTWATGPLYVKAADHRLDGVRLCHASRLGFLQLSLLRAPWSQWANEEEGGRGAKESQARTWSGQQAFNLRDGRTTRDKGIWSK